MTAYRKPSQMQLFPSPDQPQEPESRGRIFGRVTLSCESLVVLGVVTIIIMVISFSLGIERGKTMIKNTAGISVPQVAEDPAPASVVAPVSPGGPEAATAADATASLQDVANKADEEIPPREDPAVETREEKSVDNIYTVQVASFKKESVAQKEAMRLKQKGYDIMVIPKGRYSIVCVGKFAFRAEAKKFSNKLRNKYKDCLIRRL